ncbi:hypothetical protein [Salinactinospora qingdaonensis]|uniref:FtsX-like permease family protein n=1 Tax=Salinactinospora qingdaonensis TaxID=702744 RepID=A0ABP7F6G5_9ACTN
MLRDLAGGVRMALRRWPMMLSLAAMIALACVVLAFLLADVLRQLTALRGAQEMRDREAVVFTPYYERLATTTTLPDSTVADLVATIRDGHAYTAVIKNVRLDTSDFAGGRPAVILVGAELEEMVPGLDVCEPAPCAMRGAEVTQPVGPVRFAGYTLSRFEELPSAATYFDANLGTVPLDERVVLNMPPESLPRLNPVEREEAMARAVLFDVTDAEIAAHVDGNATGGLYLVPRNVAVDQPQRLTGFMVVSAMYIAGMAAFLGLVLLAFAASAGEALRRERAVFAIRRAYGAGRGHTAARIGGFVGLVVLAAPLPPLVGLWLIGSPVSSGAMWVLALVVVIFGCLWVWAVKQHSGRELRGR